MSDLEFTHLRAGLPTMVDISGKEPTQRMARAQAILDPDEVLLTRLKDGELYTSKGPVFQTAIIAGVMAAKKTQELIPFCHQVPLEVCEIDIQLINRQIVIEATARCTGKTGVEMEAMTAATVAALTVYDMCKSVSQGMVIREVKLLAKTGGKTNYQAV